MNRDCTDLLEQVETFEDRCGVRLSALMAEPEEDEDGISVRGELHAQNGLQLKQATILVCAAYDASGRVLDLAEHYFDEDTFYGFDAFSILLSSEPANVTRIKIYPKFA